MTWTGKVDVRVDSAPRERSSFPRAANALSPGLWQPLTRETELRNLSAFSRLNSTAGIFRKKLENNYSRHLEFGEPTNDSADSGNRYRGSNVAREFKELFHGFIVSDHDTGIFSLRRCSTFGLRRQKQSMFMDFHPAHVQRGPLAPASHTKSRSW